MINETHLYAQSIKYEYFKTLIRNQQAAGHIVTEKAVGQQTTPLLTAYLTVFQLPCFPQGFNECFHKPPAHTFMKLEESGNLFFTNALLNAEIFTMIFSSEPKYSKITSFTRIAFQLPQRTSSMGIVQVKALQKMPTRCHALRAHRHTIQK